MFSKRGVIIGAIRLSRISSHKMCSSKNIENSAKTNEIKTDPEMPDEPTNCCMSGCENCVWKQYAMDLISVYNHSGDQARKIILEKIKDPTMKVFLKMELQFLDDNKN